MSTNPAQSAVEPILEADLEIIDPHHHLWDRTRLISALPPPKHPFEQVLRLTPRYMLEELLADMGAGHNVVATVYMECGSMYRLDGPPELRSVGETEFVNGVAAVGASGTYGTARPCAAIVGHVDLLLGAGARAPLEAHISAGGGRFRGIRHSASYDADSSVLGPLVRAPEGLYRSGAFREGFAQLAPLGLSFDAWMLEPQLPELVELAGAFPDTQIVLDHVGTPLGIGGYAGRREERFALWRSNILALAATPNVSIKLGGLAMPFAGFNAEDGGEGPLSAQLASLWRPYLETCIEAFGPDRCMFESNFPVDRLSCPYAVLWNALKRVSKSYTPAEKMALFSHTAKRVYRLSL